MANLLDMAMEGALEGLTSEAFQALVGSGQSFLSSSAASAIVQSAGSAVSSESGFLNFIFETIVINSFLEAVLPENQTRTQSGSNNQKPETPSIDTIEMAKQLQENSKKRIKELEKTLGRKISGIDNIPEEIRKIKYNITQVPCWQLISPEAIEEIELAESRACVAAERNLGEEADFWQQAFATALLQEYTLKNLAAERMELIEKFTACYKKLNEDIMQNGNALFRFETAENGESFTVIPRERTKSDVKTFPLGKGFDKCTNDEITEYFNDLQRLVRQDQNFSDLETTVKKIISSLSDQCWQLNKKAESGFRYGDTSESFSFSMKSPSQDIAYFKINPDGRINCSLQFDRADNRDYLEFLTNEFRNVLPPDITNRAIVDYK